MATCVAWLLFFCSALRSADLLRSFLSFFRGVELFQACSLSRPAHFPSPNLPPARSPRGRCVLAQPGTLYKKFHLPDLLA